MYNYGYDYNYGVEAAESTGAAVLGMSFFSMYMIILLMAIVFAIAESVLTIIVMWKVFKKAGRHGWEAIIPFYNTWTLFDIAGYPGAYIFFGFIPYAGIIILLIFSIKAAISIGQKFKKSNGFIALLAIPFTSLIGYCILAFDNSTFDGRLGKQKIVETPSNESNSFCKYCGTKIKNGDKHCTNCGKEL